MTVVLILFRSVLLFLALLFTFALFARVVRGKEIERGDFAISPFFWAAFYAASQVPL